MTTISANCEHRIFDDVVVINDMSLSNNTVTMRIEDMLKRLNDVYGDLSLKRVIYRDSAGIFDEVVINERGKFVKFSYLGEQNLYEAMKVLREINYVRSKQSYSKGIQTSAHEKRI